ncbi:hypothetical protein [Longispora albida]|uniref:hypothetical protein n=1 Tax=Longispora albida TaxID=203523 RepID=UPI00037D7B11|nr:hypothetical protein [Longispora albida]
MTSFARWAYMAGWCGAACAVALYGLLLAGSAPSRLEIILAFLGLVLAMATAACVRVYGGGLPQMFPRVAWRVSVPARAAMIAEAVLLPVSLYLFVTADVDGWRFPVCWAALAGFTGVLMISAAYLSGVSGPVQSDDPQ